MEEKALQEGDSLKYFASIEYFHFMSVFHVCVGYLLFPTLYFYSHKLNTRGCT